MGQFNDTGYGTVTLTEEAPKNTRVTRAGAVAGLTDQDVGITTQFGKAGDVVTVSSINKQGTQKAKCDGDVEIDDRVYTADDGKISANPAAGSYFRGIAMQSGVDEEVIEIIPALAESETPAPPEP